MNPWLKSSTPLSQKKTLASQANLYEHYERSVQSPKKEVRNLLAIYHTVCAPAAAEPLSLREDFCGTAQLCAAWLAGRHDRQAAGIDMDVSVLAYAKETHFSDPAETRIKLIHDNVLHYTPPPSEAIDLLVALNYSLCYFHCRSDLIRYLGSARSALAVAKQEEQRSGVFVADLFGGSIYHQGSQDSAVKTTRDYGDFRYYFEQRALNLLDHHVECQMSFKFKDGSLARNAFHYDFRMWSIVDIKEALLEVGFKEVHLWISESTRGVESASPSASQHEAAHEVENFSTQFEHICLTDTAGSRKQLGSLPSWNAYMAAR